MALLRTMTTMMAAATVAATMLACGGDAGGEGSGAALIDTVHVRAMDVPAVVRAVGTVEADNQTQVAAEVGGQVSRVLCDEGCRASAGTPVIQIDPGDYADEVQVAAAELSRARATLTADEKLLERYTKLIDAGAIDQQTYENLQAEVESERAAVEQAAARLQTARRDLGKATVRAPFAGTVGKRHVQLGQYVSAQDLLFDLVDARPVKIRFEVPEIHVDRVREGAPIRFRVRSDTVSSRVADVDYVSPRIDPETRTFEVTATYSNPDLGVRPGAYADVELTTSIHQGAPVVPEEAIVTEGSDNFVYLVRDSLAERRAVRVGARIDGLVEILEGIEPGEIVVEAGQQGLRDGATVRIAPREAEPIERRG
ncbi:MAG: efflux RND transporter periplasmic adaptor subunit [Gemmatimonadetes bacterium]|nr:efflux RND transporter periplasmic adaptor subunit [Gemmatimonadota bacterium]